ncbi:MAG TPA: S41 family peptidase [Planctomycetaceae bacterium]|nr:S41 family peptidase [Planctomycetaceae bacterium]
MSNCRGGQFRRACAVALTVLTYCSSIGSAQAAETTLELVNSNSAVQSGIQLELGREWVSAIEHYEAALDQWPDSEPLKIGLRRARFQFAIQRRYHDRSFASNLLTLSKSEALALWNDIYGMVSRQYVERIRPTSFVAHGTESLYLALSNQDFLDHHRLKQDNPSLRQLRSELRDKYWNRPVADTRQALGVIEEIAALCRRQVGLNETVVVLEYVFGGPNVLDDYSMVLSPDKLEDLYSNIDGEFVGIGIEMKAVEGKGMLLVNVLPDSPAEKGGAKGGDYIVSINGQDCRNMTTEEAAGLLRGPEGSQVKLELMDQGEIVRGPYTLVRKPVHIKSIPVAKMLDSQSGVAYIKMTSFQRSSASELDAALSKLHKQGMRSLIWDVRGNPGGLLTAAIEVLDRFLDGGVIVSTKGRDRDQDWSYSAHRSNTWKMPLVLLVDGDSASASEIAAGALKDHKRGVLVGRHSYGKWSVQTILNGTHKTGLRLTTARFYSPSGRTYSDIGIEPNVVVDIPEEQQTFYRGNSSLNEQDDVDIAKAVEILKSGELNALLTQGN